MSKRSLSTGTMVATKHKNKVVPCSTPEHKADSPSRDSDSVCDSEAASPVPFLCTQDGAEGETDVVWNYYTPKAEQTAMSRIKNSTPLSRKARKISKPKLVDRPTPKRKVVSKVSHKKTALFQELMELNQNVHELISKKRPSELLEEKQSGSEEDIFSDSSGQSPKSCFKSSRCLRKNLLSSKFAKPDTEPALESDDSMNECLIKASQVIEENILKATPPKKPRFEPKKSNNIKSTINYEMDQDSMDAILNSIKLESPLLTRAKKTESPCLNNDSFDNLVGNLNDSTLDRLTQAPNNKSKLNNSKSTSWMIDDIVLHEESMSKSFFGRHNSMPESPSVDNKPSTSGMVITRYSSMPQGNTEKSADPSDSPIRCTQDEIKRKHQLARERLLAKRLPFTSQSSQVTKPSVTEIKKKQFQPKVPTTLHKPPNNISVNVANTNNKIPQKVNIISSNQATSLQHNNIIFSDKSKDIKLLIEKKRQEALMKLRRRQPQK